MDEGAAEFLEAFSPIYQQLTITPSQIHNSSDNVTSSAAYCTLKY